MQAKLVVARGKSNQRVVAMEGPTVIGRSREAGVTVAHPMVSRRHCEIFEQDGLLMVRDLGSLNGTTMGGRRIKLAALPPEGEFAIGPVIFRVQYHYEGDLAAMPATEFVEGQGDDTTTEEQIEEAVQHSADDGPTEFQAMPEAAASDSAVGADSRPEIPDLLAMADMDLSVEFPASSGISEKAEPPAGPAPAAEEKPKRVAGSKAKFEPDFVDELPPEFWEEDLERPSAASEPPSPQSAAEPAPPPPEEPQPAAEAMPVPEEAKKASDSSDSFLDFESFMKEMQE